MVDGQQTDDGACLYYKLTNEPKGSGGLKTCFLVEFRFLAQTAWSFFIRF